MVSPRLEDREGRLRRPLAPGNCPWPGRQRLAPQACTLPVWLSHGPSAGKTIDFIPCFLSHLHRRRVAANLAAVPSPVCHPVHGHPLANKRRPAPDAPTHAPATKRSSRSMPNGRASAAVRGSVWRCCIGNPRRDAAQTPVTQVLGALPPGPAKTVGQHCVDVSRAHVRGQGVFGLPVEGGRPGSGRPLSSARQQHLRRLILRLLRQQHRLAAPQHRAQRHPPRGPNIAALRGLLG